MAATSPKPFVLVLMPFEAAFGDVYQLGIKAACKDAGAYCERIDEQIFHENILDRLYNQIAKADIIVADMTGRNPNVFYEVGYAHALNKRVILLTRNAEDIPFDLKHYPHILYGGKIAGLKAELKNVSAGASTTRSGLWRADADVRVFVNGLELVDGVEVRYGADAFVTILRLTIMVQNAGQRMLDNDRLRLGLSPRAASRRARASRRSCPCPMAGCCTTCPTSGDSSRRLG